MTRQYMEIKIRDLEKRIKALEQEPSNSKTPNNCVELDKDCRSKGRCGRHNTFYEDMPDDFMGAIETIMQYCQNEDCDDDCSCCPHPVSEIRCGDGDNIGTSIADSIRNMDNNTLAIYLHSWQTEDMSVEEIKELLCKESQT